MAADAIQAWAHIVDIDAMLSKLKSLDDKIIPDDPHSVANRVTLLKKALLYVSMDPALQTDPEIRLRSRTSRVYPVALINTSNRSANGRSPTTLHGQAFATIHPAIKTATQPVVATPGPTQVEIATVVAELHHYTRSISSKDIKIIHEALTQEQRREFVGRVLHVLHFIEFLVLIEFVEVVVPLVYCVYLMAIYHLPNRAHYPQLADMDDAHLWSTVANIAGYTVLELVSFVCLCLVLRRKLRMSPTRQLVFVLHNQWELVQSKMILWVLVVVETSLEQFGYDYTFKFAWLKANRSP